MWRFILGELEDKLLGFLNFGMGMITNDVMWYFGFFTPLSPPPCHTRTKTVIITTGAMTPSPCRDPLPPKDMTSFVNNPNSPLTAIEYKLLFYSWSHCINDDFEFISAVPISIKHSSKKPFEQSIKMHFIADFFVKMEKPQV